jgi:hypothetical protein
MERTKLWPCPLDEKNLCTDWIEELFEDNGILRTPNDGHNGVNQFVAFVEKRLCCITWEHGKNQLSFNVLPDHFGAFYADECATKAIEFMKAKVAEIESSDNGSGNKISVQYNIEQNYRIDFFFYWDNCD